MPALREAGQEAAPLGVEGHVAGIKAFGLLGGRIACCGQGDHLGLDIQDGPNGLRGPVHAVSSRLRGDVTAPPR
ncbi:MAG TPA: hypothetical protein PLE19_12630 [Planctomycetota bacterium]|nr:hypothetical protein [Planctomycetota bacterium]HRR83251.1 hypothetical protein [Planctomycetota bacterium]HRT97121.1 hypothetical protein [Planctomycetota bacterium]